MPNLQKKSLMVSNTRSSTRSMTTMSSTLIREPAIFQANGVPLNKSSFFDKLESRLQMKPKNVIFLGMDFFINGRNCCHFLSRFFHTRRELETQITPWGWIFWTMIFYNLKNSIQDLSNEGSNFIEVGH